MPVIITFGEQGQKGHEFEANLDFIVPCKPVSKSKTLKKNSLTSNWLSIKQVTNKRLSIQEHLVLKQSHEEDRTMRLLFSSSPTSTV